MKEWLKKHFVPHEGNEHRPHALREENFRRIVALILFLELGAFVVPSILNLNLSGGMAAVLSSVLSELTNEQRQALKLPTLAENPLLTEAAQMKAEDMASKGYFAHVSPEGLTPWHWIELTGYKYQYAGENLAVNFRDSEDVTRAWLESPTHKANIVKGQYTEIGTGVATGYYKGKKTVFVAQVYANPMPKPIAADIFPISLPVQSGLTEASSDARVLGTEVAVAEEISAPLPPPAKALANAPAKALQKPSLWHKIIASPRNTANAIFAGVFFVVALALAIYITSRSRGHHADLLGNGLAVLAIAGAILLANQYLSYKDLIVAQSYDYALEDTI